MIRYSARGTEPDTGEPVQIIGLGLSDDNLTELRRGRPIFVNGKTVSAPGLRIIIHWEPDELPPDHPNYRPRP